MSIISLDTKILLFFLVSLVTAETLDLYSFEIVLSKEELADMQEQMLHTKIQSIFQPGKLYYSSNVTFVNLKKGTVDFELTWKKGILRKLYGDPRDVGKLANDVFTTLKNGSLPPTKFHMNAPPAPPVDLAAHDIQADSATITWRLLQYFEVNFYHVHMANCTNKNWKYIERVSGNTEKVWLGNLEADTLYLVKLQSENSYGVGEKSDILLVQTATHSKAIAGLYVTSCMAAMLVAGISVAIIVVIVISITVLLLCFVFGVVYYRRRKPRDLPPDTDSVTHGENVVSCLPLDNLYSSSKQECFSWNEISRDCLVMGDVLGEGEFGLVVKAILLDEQSNCDFPVAVKTVKDMATETDRGELLKELRLMANVEEHPNVVNLIGACSMEGPLLVIVEFCEFGSLLSYLRENRKELPGKGGAFVTSLDPLTRVRFAYDVAKGMCHLERKRIVHRDLAARNVLLGKNKIAKVSDFGLSRDIYEAGLYEKATGGRLPIKWMAIESLQEAKYTSKSDVWSFGVLFWEIETAGMIPYPGLSGIELLEYLQDGNRLPKPAETLSEMYELMKSCWEPSPQVRPHFQNIRFILEKYMEQRSDYVPISVDEDDNNAGPSSSYVNYNPGSPENQLVSTSL